MMYRLMRIEKEKARERQGARTDILQIFAGSDKGQARERMNAGGRQIFAEGEKGQARERQAATQFGCDTVVQTFAQPDKGKGKGTAGNKHGRKQASAPANICRS